jgi:hypothetical protein
MTDFFDELERELRRAHRRDTERSVLSRVFVRWRLSGLPVAVLRPLVALAVVAALVAVVLAVARVSDVERPVAPPGKKLVTTDLDAGIRFSLDGRILTVQLLPSAPDATLLGVGGSRISATCGSNVAAPSGDPRREITVTRLWLPSETSLSYRFPRDVSRWCTLESNRGNFHVFVWFPGASPGPRELVTQTANNWARLFGTGSQAAKYYMGQTAVEQMKCQRVGAHGPIPCTRPWQSFHAATVQDIAINGDRAAARFSNGETVELVRGHGGAWQISKIGENAGRGFFK